MVTGAFEQGGADFRSDKKTKKALKEAIAANPDEVYLYSTSAFGGWSGMASALPEDMKFNVVGPDPYKNRSWYATVTRVNGEAKCT